MFSNPLARRAGRWRAGISGASRVPTVLVLPRQRSSPRAKAILDVVLALWLFVGTAPLLFIGMLLVKLTSRGPVIYSQTRLGKDRREFTLYKLRTMVHDCERDSGVRWAVANDPRVTRVGRFLRATHIDELPQLWNVLRGDMSLVGPRPERPEIVVQLEKVIPRYGERLTARPGLTGLAQIQLPPDSDLDSVRRKLVYDLYYLERFGLWLDVRIIAATAMHVLALPFVVARVLLRVPGMETVEQRSRPAAAGQAAESRPSLGQVSC